MATRCLATDSSIVPLAEYPWLNISTSSSRAIVLVNCRPGRDAIAPWSIEVPSAVLIAHAFRVSETDSTTNSESIHCLHHTTAGAVARAPRWAVGRASMRAVPSGLHAPIFAPLAAMPLYSGRCSM